MRDVHGDWRDLFNAFRMALDLRKISLAFVGAVLSGVGIFLVLTLAFLAYQHKQGNDSGLWQACREGRWDRVSRDVQAFSRYTFARPEASAFCCRSGHKARPSQIRRCLSLPASKAGKLLYGLSGMWLLAVWSFFGGAITRIAAVELAKDERIEFGEATRFASVHRGSYLWAPLSVAAAALVFALCIMAVGWVCDATWGWWGLGKALLVLGFPLALLGGLLILLLAIGGLLGCGLMFPAVSAEGTDAFDAVSRAFSYVFSRPWRFLWYHLVAAAYAVPSCLFVIAFTFGVIRITLGLGQAGMPHAAEPGRFGEVLASLTPNLGGSLAPMHGFGQGVVACLVAAVLYLSVGMAFAYVVAYHWTAKTIIYFLLRKAVDGTEMKEVYEEESEEDLVAGGAASTPPPAPPA
jgi:hypothetical protein